MRKYSGTFLFCLFLATGSGALPIPSRKPATGDRLPPEPRPVREFAGVSLVEVPVNVLRRDGKPVQGLTLSDFEIEEDGKKQTIVSLDVVDLSLRQPGAEPVVAAARRHLLLLFDLSFASSNQILRSRDAAIRFIQNGLDPDDLVAVASTSTDRGVRLHMTFTSDRRQIVDSIRAVGLPRDADRARDPLAFIFSAPGGVPLSTSTEEQSRSNAIVVDPTSALRIYAAMAQKNSDDYEVTRVGRHLGDMSALAAALDAVEGRKTVIYFSEGFDARLLLGSMARQQSPEQTQADNDAMFSGKFWTFDVDRRYADSPLQRELNDTISLFRRSDCVVYAIDIAGLKQEHDATLGTSHHGEEFLFAFASGTGGEVIRNANDFETQMRRVAEKTSLTYVLSFRSSNPADGKFHSLRVRVKAKAARVSARAGYYATKSFRSMSPLERSLAAADVITHEKERGDLPIEVAVVSLAEKRISRVPVLIQIPGGALPPPPSAERLSLGIYVYATDESGRLADYFTRVVTIDPAREGERFARGLTFYGTCRLLPGRYRMRVYVRDELSGRFGFRVTPIEVPEFSAETMHALPPLFVGDDVGGLRLKDSSATAAEPEPFQVGDTAFVPQIVPTISAGAHSRVCLMLYRKVRDGSFAPLEIDAEIFDMQGRTRGPAKLALIGRTAPGAEGLVRLLLDFTPADLPAGEYSLRVVFRDSQDQTRRVESEARFRVS